MPPGLASHWRAPSSWPRLTLASRLGSLGRRPSCLAADAHPGSSGNPEPQGEGGIPRHTQLRASDRSSPVSGPEAISYTE